MLVMIDILGRLIIEFAQRFRMHLATVIVLVRQHLFASETFETEKRQTAKSLRPAEI